MGGDSAKILRNRTTMAPGGVLRLAATTRSPSPANATAVGVSNPSGIARIEAISGGKATVRVASSRSSASPPAMANVTTLTGNSPAGAAATSLNRPFGRLPTVPSTAIGAAGHPPVPASAGMTERIGPGPGSADAIRSRDAASQANRAGWTRPWARMGDPTPPVASCPPVTRESQDMSTVSSRAVNRPRHREVDAPIRSDRNGGIARRDDGKIRDNRRGLADSIGEFANANDADGAAPVHAAGSRREIQEPVDVKIGVGSHVRDFHRCGAPRAEFRTF